MPANDDDKWWDLAGRILNVYAILWMTAVGGIVGANTIGLVGLAVFSPDLKAENAAPWSHWGWYIGTALFLFGALSGRLRMTNQFKWNSVNQKALPAGDPNSNSDAGKDPLTDQDVSASNQSWQSWCLGGALAGGILGFLFGASLLTFFFSFVYSPFATKEAIQSIEVVVQRMPNSGRQQGVLTATGWFPVLLSITPAILGSTGGALILTFLHSRQSRSTSNPNGN